MQLTCSAMMQKHVLRHKDKDTTLRATNSAPSLSTQSRRRVRTTTTTDALRPATKLVNSEYEVAIDAIMRAA